MPVFINPLQRTTNTNPEELDSRSRSRLSWMVSSIGIQKMGAEILIKIAGGMTVSKSPSHSISLGQQHEEYVWLPYNR